MSFLDEFDPKSNTSRDIRQFNYLAAYHSAIIDAYKSIYYGNKPYTDNDIRETLKSYKEKVGFRNMKGEFS